jgi:hypothetical protein
MNEFLRPAAVSSKRGCFATEDHADRFTATKKNGTSAETYIEPQTPVNRFTVALPSQNSQSLAQPPMPRNGLPHSEASSWTWDRNAAMVSGLLKKVSAKKHSFHILQEESPGA